MDETGLKLTDAVYAAGYLDAEGCFRFGSTTRVSISNTYPVTLYWFQKLFGGSVTERKTTSPKHRTPYEWRVTGEKARKCIKQLLPFLKEKLPQAIILLEVLKYPPHSAKRQTLIDELTKLKRIDHAWTI